MPPLEEIAEIMNEVNKVMSIADAIERVLSTELKRATALRQSILQKAFEGRLVRQDADDEPAAVLLERIRAERQGRVPTLPEVVTSAPRRGHRRKVASRDQGPLR